MPEKVRRSNYEELPEDNRQIIGLRKSVRQEIGSPVSFDPVERAMLTALLPELSPGGRVFHHMLEAYALRRTRQSFFPPGYDLRALEFAIDKQMRRMFDEETYPLFFPTPASWNRHEVFDRMDYVELHRELGFNLKSSMADAYAIYDLMTKIFRIGQEQPTVLDVGASLGLGLKKWLLTKEGFRPITVVKSPERGRPLVPGEMEIDEEYQEIVDYLAGLPPAVGRAYGIDSDPVSEDDPEAVERVFSHTFPMSESRHRPAEVREFKRLTSARSAKVILPNRYIDVRRSDAAEDISQVLDGKKADFGILSAMLFEQHPDDIANIWENLRQNFSPDGKVFVTDFISHVGPRGFSFVRGKWWRRPGSFATYAVDPHRPEDKPIGIARFTTRRATEMILMPEGKKILKAAVD